MPATKKPSKVWCWPEHLITLVTLNGNSFLLKIQRATQISASQIENKADWDKSLSLIQHWLFDLGGEVCIPNYHLLQPICIEFLEKEIDHMNESLPMLKEFILPSGSLACSYAHQARAVCRRAERTLMSVHSRDQNIQATALQLLNRLSDWFFVASRALQRAEGGSEVLWQKNINETI